MSGIADREYYLSFAYLQIFYALLVFTSSAFAAQMYLK